MRRVLFALAVLAIALPLAAERIVDENGRVIQVFRPKDHPTVQGAGPQARASNLVYHNGPVITQAQVVSIFWGPSWGTNANPGSLAFELMNFFGQFGNTGEYNVITQYSGIQKGSLSNQYWIDQVNPSNVAVTDAMIQAEVINYFNAGYPIDPNTIYEVFLPAGYYAQIGTATSCGGPHLQFCAYHSNFSYGGIDVKYASMPQPSCSGCQSTGWTTGQNFEHFATHETREAVTDPDGNAWYDRQGNEADDKCAWSPTPFLDPAITGYGYQYEWSNADGKCVKTR